MDTSLTDNVPNDAMNEMAYTPIFGNTAFEIVSNRNSEVVPRYALITDPPSLEALVYMQQMNAQISPTNIVSGQNTGEQNIQGAYTVKDSLGSTRVSIGFQQTDTGSY